MRSFIRPILLALALAVTAAPAYADGTIGTPLYKNGDIFVRFLGAEALYDDELHFFVTAPGASQYLFGNHSTTPGAEVSVDDGALAMGAEVIFGICVFKAGTEPNGSCEGADHTLYSGDGSLNADGLAHVKVWTAEDYAAEFGGDLAGYDYVIGFEDILGGGDLDYNDLVFAVAGTVTPEPLSMTLLATGLVGLGAAHRRRRKVGA